MTTAYWSPNQAAVPQVETYTFTAPSSVGNWYMATINGKTVTYTSISGDTAATVATGLYDLLSQNSGVPPELLEITFANPSSGVVTATAKVAGTPFANVSGTSAGLVLSTGNGLANGITTAHTTANKSPSDVFDAQNWLRVTAPAPGVRAIPVNGDDVVVSNTNVPMLWNLDQLAAVQFATYTRWQTMEGEIGLPENNPGGYSEWRATYFKFSGPTGSVPAGGLQMFLGQGPSGNGPGRERYNVGSSPTTLTVAAAGQAIDEYGVRFLGMHTANAITLLGDVSLALAMLPGEISNINSITVDGTARLGLGDGVAWTGGTKQLLMYGGTMVSTANSSPTTLDLHNGAQATIMRDSLSWPLVKAQGGSQLNWMAGGTISTLTMTTSSVFDKSEDARALTITNSTIDGDTCVIDDPLNSITFTNATLVNQQVSSGPFKFTGARSVKVT